MNAAPSETLDAASHPNERADDQARAARHHTRPHIMGILNVTPDSFSDGGAFERDDRTERTRAAVRAAERLAADGATIVDVGGESTRPGARRVPQGEEAQRVVPVVRALAERGIAVSVDTMNATTAAAALDAGATWINDVSGGRADEAMLPLVADRDTPFVLSHWRGHSIGMNALADYADPAREILDELARARDAAVAAGLAAERIVLDPGLGFAKRAADNWAVLHALPSFVALGHPLLVGASRKRFTADLLAADAPVTDRDLPTAIISALCAREGVWGLRVHDAAATRIALDVVDAWTRGADHVD